MPWSSQNIEHHRTPELFGHPAKIYYLDNWNSLSNSCHVMPWLIYSIMEKKWYCKKWNIWKNRLKGFFFFWMYHPKLMYTKYVLSISMTVFWLLTQLWGWNFHFSLILNFNFWGVPSTFQGIVPAPLFRGPWKYIQLELPILYPGGPRLGQPIELFRRKSLD